MRIINKIKKLETLEEMHKKILSEEKKEWLNIQATRDFVEVWKIFLTRGVDRGWLNKFELQILEMLQVYWGKGSFIDVDRDLMIIKCYGNDGRELTL